MRPEAFVTVCLTLMLAAFVPAGARSGASVSSAAAPQATPAVERFGLGRPATAEEIRAIDIDVMPDGRGLPPGRGTVAEGEATYKAKCQSCHGVKGEGKPFDRLVGRDAGAGRTIGNYWPYATTVYDYTQRSMPFLQPGTLTPDELYGLVAYLLFLNDIVPDTAVMNAASLPKVAMPNQNGFVRDNRTGGPVVR